MCIDTERTEQDDRFKRFKRRKLSNKNQRNYADAEKPIKPVKIERQPVFESDDPLAGIDLRRVRSLRDLE